MEWTVERHLTGQPAFAIYLYRQFIAAVETIGPFTYPVSKTTITRKGERRGFAGARPFRQGVRCYLDLQHETGPDGASLLELPSASHIGDAPPAEWTAQ
ncbi:hypothetical protein [Microbacterium sp.]|uniref:hypothetical protein n=1 Tax=Microbacterium sp. TaxID=51671 RepID=UPI0037C79878